MRKTALHSAAVMAAAVLLPATSYAQDQGTLYKQVNGWTITQFVQSESSADPSCSAVYIQNRFDGLRIEKVSDGYLFGINGLSREEQGDLYPLKFWFDGDRSQELSGEAGFIKDAAYPYDDWLSYFHAADAQPSPIDAIGGLNSMSFAFQMPGNRTGNDEVTVTYELKGSAAALLALEECYTIASTGGVMPTGASEGNQLMGSSDCPDDGPKLPGSGVCQGRGVNYLNIVDGSAPELDVGCEWKLNEAAMPGGDYLFYLASSCGVHLSQLEFAAGAQTADVNLVKSAMGNGDDWGSILTVIAVDEADPKASLLQFVRNGMDDKAEAAKCRVAAYGGGPADALVIDNLSPAEAKADMETSMEPRWACGEYGLNQDSQSFWRIFGGFAWYFDLGQDAYFDIDPRSLTVVSAADLN